MKFTKAPLGLPELARHLKALGLEGDEDLIVRRLRYVGYYRLSPYWRCFREDATALSSRLRPGTTIEAVWRLYTFDRELRLLALDALERTEVGLRACLVQRHVEEHGPFGYARDERVAAAPSAHYGKLVQKIEADLRGAVDKPSDRHLTEPMLHFAQTYADCHPVPPLWLAAEAFSLGDLVTLYKGSPHGVQKAVAREFGLPEDVLRSWLLVLHTVRNICAHHGRLWNRVLGTRPRVPRKLPAWSDRRLGSPDRTFYALSMLAHFMGRLSDGSRWGDRFRRLVDERYPELEKTPMGLATGWERHPVWAARLSDGW